MIQETSLHVADSASLSAMRYSTRSTMASAALHHSHHTRYRTSPDLSVFVLVDVAANTSRSGVDKDSFGESCLMPSTAVFRSWDTVVLRWCGFTFSFSTSDMYLGPHELQGTPRRYAESYCRPPGRLAKELRCMVVKISHS
ncbi:hypothetical protein BAUCODRAFT_181078 [Baudoinia panamericana UAMH 10762]|uniref:Uncharacterized protein n=1 Tax=Baudoinia panamericana (strain UAMH 10762) TaxID=717646 RepID=M2N974_BAUPA|nr:uncharacterized protein BAUCODRAFT_181078 [Baudoinia panamericana UAMH 10762]EMD00719.1 hypothetical protein BAUCODRAFT_181078 [Baudoinia panamericana UAMH 10762]